jgi:hypothetical protein
LNTTPTYVILNKKKDTCYQQMPFPRFPLQKVEPTEQNNYLSERGAHPVVEDRMGIIFLSFYPYLKHK